MERTDLFYYLDANSFYQYIDFKLPGIGISSKIETKKFIKDLDFNKNIILPSCVYTEIFLRFYNRPDLLTKIKNFIIKKNIRIEQAGTYIIERNILLDNELTANLREELLIQKINDEAGIIYIFITITTNEYLIYKLRMISPTKFEIYIPGIIGYIENTRKDKTIDFIKKRLEFFYNEKEKIKPQDLIY